MDGLELARCIRLIAPDMRLLMVSGYFYRDDISIQEAIAQGVIIDFISKPFLQEEILRVLHT
jgi:YesN/AraC family two-component response regulator